MIEKKIEEFKQIFYIWYLITFKDKTEIDLESEVNIMS